MKKPFKVTEKLPQHNQYVLAHLTLDNWRDGDDPLANRYWVVVKFVKGISKAERVKLPDSDKRKRTIYGCDEHGNNLKPYEWDSFGPSSYFGQYVDVWCELPNLGDIA